MRKVFTEKILYTTRNFLLLNPEGLLSLVQEVPVSLNTLDLTIILAVDCKKCSRDEDGTPLR